MTDLGDKIAGSRPASTLTVYKYPLQRPKTAWGGCRVVMCGVVVVDPYCFHSLPFIPCHQEAGVGWEGAAEFMMDSWDKKAASSHLFRPTGVEVIGYFADTPRYFQKKKSAAAFLELINPLTNANLHPPHTYTKVGLQWGFVCSRKHLCPLCGICMWSKAGFTASSPPADCRNPLLRFPPCLFLDLARRPLFTDV